MRPASAQAASAMGPGAHLGEIHDVDVVANGSAITGVVVITEHAEHLPLPKGHLHAAGHAPRTLRPMLLAPPPQSEAASIRRQFIIVRHQRRART